MSISVRMAAAPGTLASMPMSSASSGQGLDGVVRLGELLELGALAGFLIDGDGAEGLGPLHDVLGGREELQEHIGAAGVILIGAEAGKVVAQEEM